MPSRANSLGFVAPVRATPPAAAPPRAEAKAADVEAAAAAPQALPARRLVRWNVAMFVFHAALATTTLLVGNRDLTVPLYRAVLTFRVNPDAAPAWELVPSYEESWGLPFTWLTAVFFLLSALAHLLNATLLRALYLRALANCLTPLRWIEYFFSAPLMIVLVGYTLGIRDRAVTVANAALVATTMPFGYWTEQLARPASPDAWTRPLYVRLVPFLLGHVPQCAAWLLILLQFYDGLAEEANDRTPAFVYAILWAELVLFFSFGAASLLAQLLPPRLFYRGEILFQVLSLVSKGVLGGLLLINVLLYQTFEEAIDNATE
jgi:hypothetical protein